MNLGDTYSKASTTYEVWICTMHKTHLGVHIHQLGSARLITTEDMMMSL
jgi:hypothetical protein